MTATVPSDAERADVELAFDPSRAGPVLADLLGLDGGACEILDAKYEPGTKAVFLYDVGGRSVVAGARWDDEAAARSPAGVPVPGTALVAHAFPDDPALPGLRRVLEPAGLGDALGVPIADVTVVRYRPGRRVTLRGDGPAGTRFAKVYHDGAKAAAVDREMVALAAALHDTGAPVVVAPTAGFVADVPLVAQLPVAGEPLDDLPTGPEAPSVVRRAGVALAALHAIPPVSERRRPIAKEVTRFGKRAAAAATVRPDVGDALGALARDLAATLPADEPEGLVHGDCKPSQFLADGERLALLDFDHCGVADPAGDVGTFLATLRQTARWTGAPDDVWRTLQDEALSGYGRDGDWVRRARWYEVAALVRKGLRAFSRDPWSDRASILAVAAREALEELGAGGGRP